MNNNRKRLYKVLSVCSIFLLIMAFYYHIDKHLTGIPFFILVLLIPFTFVFIAIYALQGLYQLIAERKDLPKECFISAIIALMTLTYTFLSPWKLDSENFESDVILRACYEGTQNQATLKFRKDNTFEIRWTGVFFYEEWFTGNFIQKGDSLFLKYNSEKPRGFGDSIVNTGRSLISINKFKKDSNQVLVPFYLGYCQGLN